MTHDASPVRTPAPPPDAPGRWIHLGLIAFASTLAMGLWFSASAVVPQLAREWGLGPAGQAWLTITVQGGFVAGALLSAALNLPDRLAPSRLFAAGALLGAAATAAIALLRPGPGAAMALRFLTGAALAGVYPPGMKLAATWAVRDRGLAIGLLVGALAVGSALPHLLGALPGTDGGLPPWPVVLLAAASLAAAGGLLVALFGREGPHRSASAPFNARYAWRLLADRPVRLANFGYLGHMWELYAMWTWAPIFLASVYASAGWSARGARLAGFAVIAAGGLGSFVAGSLADRFGRTAVTVASLAASGACCLAIGPLSGSPAALTLLALVWGFAVVADSAQFSAAVSELSDPRYVGTALAVQTALGFLLTMVTIGVVPFLVGSVGWGGAFATLAIGPAFGIASMLRLRALPEARRMANGQR